MPFPKKFKKLLEISLNDVAIPDCIWLTYAVCAMEVESCGWGGWIIESAYKHNEADNSTEIDNKANIRVLDASDTQECPRCGKDLFRTDASVKYELSKDQTPPLVPDIDYEVLPIEYDED